jgi:hypothetical protein
MIPKMLVSTAIVLGSLVVGAAPASADPNPSDAHQNPFGSLTSSSRGTVPASGSALAQELDRGIRDGLSRR